MMGRSHAASGWCVGVAVAPLLVDSVVQVVAFAVVTAGYALLPDLDHPHARASRLLGPLTGFLSYLMREASEALYARTKGPEDEDWNGGHRHMTHTLLFALLVGGLVALASWIWPPFVWIAIGFGILLALDALGSWLATPLLLAGAGLLVSAWTGAHVLEAATNLDALAGLAVFTGCLTHCLGDSLTLAGCPVLFPLPIQGETWFELGPPTWMRFRTGGTVEKLVLFPVFTIAGVLLTPGVLDSLDKTFTWIGGVA